MTTENIANLKKVASEILTHHRLQLINNHPFIGTIAMNLNLVPIRDARVRTAGTDGKNIYVDIDFLSRLTPDEITFVLGHEVWHVVMMHHLRGEGKDHTTFNVATDMEVNQLLDADGFKSPEEALFPNKTHGRHCEFNFPDGLSAEEYYDLLQNMAGRKNAETEMKSTETKMKSKNSNVSGQFDKHFDQNEDQEKALEEAMKDHPMDKYGEKGADEDYQPTAMHTENEKKEAMEKIREAVVGAAQTIERTRGMLPDYIKKYVNKLLDPKMPWKELLASFITSSYFNKTNWNRPNRRFAYSGTYLPSHSGDMMRIAVGIDTSGSCSEDFTKFVSELSGITRSFDGYELHMLECDTEVKNYTLYNEDNPLNPEDGIEFQGSGGTKLQSIFNYIEDNDLDVDAVVIFTDGECEDFEDEFEVPVLWAITGNSNCENLKMGEKIYLKD